MKKKTLMIHGGITGDEKTGAVSVPIYQVSTYKRPKAELTYRLRVFKNGKSDSNRSRSTCDRTGKRGSRLCVQLRNGRHYSGYDAV